MLQSLLGGAGGKGTNAVFVVGDNPPLDPQTNKVACAQTPAPVPFFRTAFSRVFYESNMTQAQFALNFQGLTPTQVVLEAIGRGIGNNAGHEVGHQLRISGMDDDSTATYNGGTCDGEKAPWVFTGVGTDPARTPIHWGPRSANSLNQILGNPQ